MLAMFDPVFVGDQQFHRFTDDVILGVTEGLLGLGVEVANHTIGTGNDHGLGCGMNDAVETGRLIRGTATGRI